MPRVVGKIPELEARVLSLGLARIIDLEWQAQTGFILFSETFAVSHHDAVFRRFCQCRSLKALQNPISPNRGAPLPPSRNFYAR